MLLRRRCTLSVLVLLVFRVSVPKYFMRNSGKNFKMSRGLTLVEVLIATSIITVFLVALFGVHSLYLKTAFSNGDIIKAAQLAEEGLEAIKFLRNTSWESNIAPLSLDTDYY